MAKKKSLSKKITYLGSPDSKIPEIVPGQIPGSSAVTTNLNQYVSNFLEYAARNREQISKGAVVIGAGNSTLYQVPEGFSMFVTGFSMNSFITGGNSLAVAIATGGISNTSIVFGVITGRDLAVPIANSMERIFINPLKILTGSAIVVESSIANQIVSGVVTGWLEPNSV